MNGSHETALQYLRRTDDGRSFYAPWQATAFAIVVQLQKDGHFDWQEWTQRLGRELRHAGPEDKVEDYYEHWLEALETLLRDKSILPDEELQARLDYLIRNPVPHDHVARTEPVFVSEALNLKAAKS